MLFRSGNNPRKRPEMAKSRVLSIPLQSCTGGHKASKAPLDTRIVGYNPRKWPEMFEIISFADIARVVYRGSQGFESRPGPEIMGNNPRKRPEMAKSRVLSIPLQSCTGGHKASKAPWTRKSWVITHENGLKWPKS